MMRSRRFRRPLRLASTLFAAIAAALIAWAIGISSRFRDGSTAPPESASISETPRAGVFTINVLVLNFDPPIASMKNRPLHEALGWQNPRALASGYVADLMTASAGVVRYRIVEWLRARRRRDAGRSLPSRRSHDEPDLRRLARRCPGTRPVSGAAALRPPGCQA
jgi:hypothetical protein